MRLRLSWLWAVVLCASSALATRFVLPKPAPAGAAAFDENVAQYLLSLSAAAYSDQPGACSLASSTLNVTSTFNDTFLGFGTFAFTAVDSGSNAIILAFRGTNSIEELIEEALTSIEPVPFWPDPSLQLNAFFYGCEGLWYDDLKTEVQALIAANPTYQIYATGHSLGGAVATVTVMHLLYDSVLSAGNPIVYTFGEPRVGDFAFAQKYNSLVPSAYRVVHYRDTVAHLPPCHASFDSKLEYICDGAVDPNDPELWAYHHGTEVWYQEAMPLLGSGGGSFAVCTGTPFGEDFGCSDGLILKDSIPDHLHYYQIEVGQYCLSV